MTINNLFRQRGLPCCWTSKSEYVPTETHSFPSDRKEEDKPTHHFLISSFHLPSQYPDPPSYVELPDTTSAVPGFHSQRRNHHPHE